MEQETKKRVLYVVYTYGQASETYIAVEAAAVREDYEIDIVALTPPNHPCREHLPHTRISDFDALLEHARAFRPDVIHTHWIFDQLDTVYRLAETLGVPFTVRTHSFDVLWRQAPFKRRIKWYFKYRRFRPMLNSPLCLGVLCFPFAVALLKRSGIRESKLVSCYPVVDFERFYSREPHTEGVLNFGAAVGKKGFERYYELAELCPEVPFDLYAIGYHTDRYREAHEAMGGRVHFKEPVEHSQMPEVFRTHNWLVYTANPDDPLVGWPIAAAEAQAAGVGVCLPNLRPDMQEYLGGGGYLYDAIEELKDIVTREVPEAVREKGYEQARKSDIRGHLHLLTDLWNGYWSSK